MKARSKLIGALVLASSVTLLTLRVMHSQFMAEKAGPEEKRRVMLPGSKASIDYLVLSPKEREIEFGKTGDAQQQSKEKVRQLWSIPALENIPTAFPWWSQTEPQQKP